MILTFFIVALVGFAIGVVSGLVGVGGGTMMVPALRLAFGLSPVSTTATSLFAIIPTSISGAVQHVRHMTCVPKLGIALGIGGACLSPLGVWLAQVSPGWLVMTVCAVAIGYSAATMLRKALDASAGGPGSQAKTLEGEGLAHDPGPSHLAHPSSSAVMKAVPIGALVGLISGYIGLGGGFLMIPLMVSVLRMPMRIASGTSLIAVMILALPATVAQCVLGNVDYLAGTAIVCGSIPGALVGARLVSRVPERALRFAFAALLGVASVLLIAKELGAM